MAKSEVTGSRATSSRFLMGSLLVVFISCFLASRIQSSDGHVEVTGIKIPTENGQWVVADLYKPRSATSRHPAPLVVVVPGFQRSKESLANVAIELSRRGIVVISIDPYAQGSSSSSESPRAATTEGYGLFAVVEYVMDTPNLNYVDKSRVGAMGHSAGGNAVLLGASHFGREAIRTGRPSKLQSVYVSGYVLSLKSRILKDVRSNVGLSYARYDEGAYRNELHNADMRWAPEALRLVNSSRPDTAGVIREVQLDHYYGSVGSRTLRVVHNEHVLHPFQTYDPTAMTNLLAFFQKVFGLRARLANTDQVWYWKELLGLIALVASFLTLVPLARLLLDLPFFRPVVHDAPEALPRPRGWGRALFWSILALGALVACFSYIPMARLSQRLFVAASSRETTWFFPQRMNNAVLLWAVFNGLLGFGGFFAAYRWHGRRHGVDGSMWGGDVSVGELVRALTLGLTLFAFYALLLFVVYYFLHVDYRFLFMGARTFRPAMLVVLALYAPLFFVFFLFNSLQVNGAMRFRGESEGRSMLVAGLANSVGLLLIVVVQYVTFAVTGTVYWTTGWLYVNLLFAIVPMMFVLPYFNRYFFRMTGRIYLGAMVTCLVFTMILLTNTVCYLPI